MQTEHCPPLLLFLINIHRRFVTRIAGGRSRYQRFLDMYFSTGIVRLNRSHWYHDDGLLNEALIKLVEPQNKRHSFSLYLFEQYSLAISLEAQ